jgi:transcriptional regulator with XRE-family HTH domain
MTMDRFTKKIFARNLKIARQELGKTQLEFAAKIGMSAATVSCWEKGVAFPSELTLKKILYFHGIREDFLLYGKGEMRTRQDY